MLSVCVITCKTGRRRSGYQPLYAWATSCSRLALPHFAWLGLLTTHSLVYRGIQANHCTNLFLKKKKSFTWITAYEPYTCGKPSLTGDHTAAFLWPVKSFCWMRTWLSICELPSKLPSREIFMRKLVAQVFFTVLAPLWPFFGITHVTRAQNTILKVMTRKCWFDCREPDFLKHLLVCNADCQKQEWEGDRKENNVDFYS